MGGIIECIATFYVYFSIFYKVSSRHPPLHGMQVSSCLIITINKMVIFLAVTKQLLEHFCLPGLNASILVWHTCASALSGWVLYRPLELTKLTCPDLHHVVGLFILREVRQSLEYPCLLRVLRTSPCGFLGSLVIQSIWICCLRVMGISVK